MVNGLFEKKCSREITLENWDMKIFHVEVKYNVKNYRSILKWKGNLYEDLI